MLKQRGMLLGFLLGLSLLGLLTIGCGRRVITRGVDIKGQFDKVTTGMTGKQVVELFEPTSAEIIQADKDGQIIIQWRDRDKDQLFRAVIAVEGDKVVSKDLQTAERRKEVGPGPREAKPEENLP